MYKALYRTWRPQTFGEVVGQQHIVRTLRNSTLANKISHAYLFVGPRGTGKTSIAKIFAKTINCLAAVDGEPCCKCDNCKAIADGSFMDVYEMDAASNRGIDEIRDIIERVKFHPADGKFKVYIVDEVHMLTNEAFNALLKTLEEPPAYVVFILCTTDVQKVPATILSRCQRYDFGRIDKIELVRHLRFVADSSKITIDDAALNMICEHAAGGARDALSILDQCAIMSNNKIDSDSARALLGLSDKQLLANLVNAIFTGNLREIIALLDNSELSQDVRQIFSDMLKYAQEQLHVSIGNNDLYAAKRLSGLIIDGSATIAETRWSTSPRLVIEAALIKLALGYAPDIISEVNAEPPSVAADIVVTKNVAVKVESVAPAAPVAITPEIIPAEINEPAPKTAVEEVAQSDYSAVWDNVLAELMRMNKRLVIECAKTGKLQKITDNVAIVAFPKAGKFFKERLEKDDYRKQVEIALRQIVGRELALTVIIDEHAEKKVAKSSKIEQLSEFFGVEVKKI